MLKTTTNIPFDDKHWQRINMRSVSHLLGAEMLHNLYNRHWARINSLRFRHTVTTYKQGIVEAYAPIDEWQYLQNWLSKKFANLDTVLIREIETIMNPDYKFVDEIITKVNGSDLEKISDDELGLLLIDIMDYPLGEIYKLNVVQIEYSLNYALHKILEEYEPNLEDRNLLLAKLISPGELTVSQIEEVAFADIVQLALSSPDDILNAETLEALNSHYDQFAATHCAYGENPPAIEDYKNKLQLAVQSENTPITKEEAIAEVKRQHEQSKALLSRLNDSRLDTLCDLMSRIGVFRDKNKAKLGETVVKRLEILSEISRRKEVPIEDVDLYLMSELTDLIENDIRLSADVLETRREEGVSFVRNEDVTSPLFISIDVSNQQSVISGICASPGKVEGVVKVIHSKDDIDKIDSTDIMVAIGTDFDLLEIMNVCSGIITEEGGLLSHASVVSRELKKPCLIGVVNATKLLKDGDSITLDATEGKITLR